MRDQVAMDASPGAGCSSVPHDIHTVQHDAPVELSTECFSVAELKQRALRMFITSSGGAPRASGCGLVMGAITALLIINVTKAIEQLMGTPRKPLPLPSPPLLLWRAGTRLRVDTAAAQVRALLARDSNAPRHASAHSALAA